MDETAYPVSWMITSCQYFIHLVETTPTAFLPQKIIENFNIYQAGGRKKARKGEMLVTGYYEPLLTGSLTRKAPFLYPLYSVPEDLVTKEQNGKKRILRKTASGNLLPYWSREEIEENKPLKGYELVFLKDPFDAFSLHVQGSGKILLQNGTLRSIRYAGSNGHQYHSIGKLLVDRGIMKREDVTMPKIRQYLVDHPEQLKDILYHNKRYIFFSWANTNIPPAGSTGATLTPTRSIAIDPKTLPTGAIAYLTTRYPTIENGKITSWQPFRRFVLPQDSGSAIKGAGRVDIFWGNGTEAKAIAGSMKEKGKLFFLVKKGYTGKRNVE